MKQKKVTKNLFKPKNSYEQFAQEVYNLLVENFSQTFFVGGMVRNLLWHKKITDIDIATCAKPAQMIKLLNQTNYSVDVAAQRFGVINVRQGQHSVQVTTFRTERYTDDRYPKVKFTTSLAADAKRRDFTINSLYFNTKTCQLVDPFGGLIDLKNKLLRAVGNPATKFSEDPLRIVRAFRFQKQFNLRIEARTKRALQNSLLLVNTLTKTKINSEINKVSSLRVQNYLQKKFL